MNIFARLCVFVACALHCSFLNAEKTTMIPVPPPTTAKEWESHREFFRANGYIWIKDFFSADQVDQLHSWAKEMNRAAQDVLNQSRQSGASLREIFQQIPKKLVVVPESKNPEQVCRVEDMLTCYPSMYEFFQTNVLCFMNYLLEEPYVAFKDKLNFKWPGGGAFLPHQDFPAYELLAPREHVTAMITIDPATQENGCLQVAKSWKETFTDVDGIDQEALSKGRAVIPYVIGGSAHGSIEDQYVEKITWLPLETSPRDLVLFNSYLPHYSEMNASNSSRRAMFFTCNRLAEGECRAAYYDAKRNDPDNPIFHVGTPTKARGK